MRLIIRKIKDFIISPKYIASLSGMNRFFVLFIIAIGLLLLIFPVKWVLNSKIKEFGENNKYIKDLYSIDADTVLLNNIKETEFKITDKKALTTSEEISTYSFTNDNVVCYYVFDTYDIVADNLNNLNERIREMTSSPHTAYISILSYIDIQRGLTEAEAIDLYINRDEQYLKNRIESLSYLDIYGVSYDKNKSNYLIAFNNGYMYVQLPVENNYYAATFAYTQDLNIKDYQQTKSFIIDINNQIAVSLINDEYNNYVLYTTVYFILAPFALASVVYVLSKSAYKIKFKSIYKTSVILTMVPAIIAAVSSLYFKTAAFFIFVFTYILYALIMNMLARKHIVY